MPEHRLRRTQDLYRDALATLAQDEATREAMERIAEYLEHDWAIPRLQIERVMEVLKPMH